jgi:hypothetical protein
MIWREPKALGSDEAAWAENRRSDMIYVPVENTKTRQSPRNRQAYKVRMDGRTSRAVVYPSLLDATRLLLTT